MKTIELEKGWLVRQLKEVRQEVEKWPDVLKPLCSLNASLVEHPVSAKSQAQRVPVQSDEPLRKPE